MPKKRHQTRYSKPQSTAPASLSSSSATHNASGHDDHERPSVNALLASMRRTRLNGDTPLVNVVDIAAPSVPPQIRAILRLPEPGPAPPPRLRPRVGPRFDANGRRLPPGPAAPRSWLSLSRHAPRLDFSDSSVNDFERRLIPGLYRPGYGSLVDIVLRKITLDWEFQRSYCVHYLSSLPDHLRMALISYLTTISGPGVSLADLKIILLPLISDDNGEDLRFGEDPSTFNEGITHLDLSTSVGRSIKLRELAQLLFSSESTAKSLPPESWDTDETLNVPRPLLPNLTHLSIAADPEDVLCSWRQLLSIATHLPTLTHLSLAYWPVPCMTPNLTFTNIVASNGQTFQAGGTNPYSHSLDNQWSEQILILRKLSQSLYGLEYLDLTGCNHWFKALTASADGDQVDWVGDWGKITHLIMTTGYAPPLGLDLPKTEKFNEVVSMATSVERTVRHRRAGRGRIFTVERDAKVDPISLASS